jgi:hypothetical protein
MSRRDVAAPTDPTPASEARPIAATDATANDSRATFRRRFGEAFTEVIEGMDLATYDEIHQRYGGDPEREIVDIKAGKHPLQHGGRDLDAFPRYESKLATIRAQLGR